MAKNEQPPKDIFNIRPEEGIPLSAQERMDALSEPLPESADSAASAGTTEAPKAPKKTRLSRKKVEAAPALPEAAGIAVAPQLGARNMQEEIDKLTQAAAGSARHPAAAQQAGNAEPGGAPAPQLSDEELLAKAAGMTPVPDAVRAFGTITDENERELLLGKVRDAAAKQKEIEARMGIASSPKKTEALRLAPAPEKTAGSADAGAPVPKNEAAGRATPEAEAQRERMANLRKSIASLQSQARRPGAESTRVYTETAPRAAASGAGAAQMPSAGPKGPEAGAPKPEAGVQKGAEAMKAGLEKRSEELTKKLDEAVPEKKGWITRALERYNKLNWFTKLTITAGLVAGTALSAIASAPLLTAAFTAGLWSQRAVGAVGFALNRRYAIDRAISKDPTHPLARSGNFRKDLNALGQGALYFAATGFLTRFAVHALEGWEPAKLAADNVKDWLGRQLGHPERVTITPRHPGVDDNSVIVKPYQAPSVTPIPVPVPLESGGHAAAGTPGWLDWIENKDAGAGPVASSGSEVPPIFANAKPGLGYEAMLKDVWREMQARHIDPSQYANNPDFQNSDLAKLASADASSIDKVVHQIASDPNHGFYNADGTSVRVNPGEGLAFNKAGQIMLMTPEGAASVHAMETHVTPPVGAAAEASRPLGPAPVSERIIPDEVDDSFNPPVPGQAPSAESAPLGAPSTATPAAIPLPGEGVRGPVAPSHEAALPIDDTIVRDSEGNPVMTAEGPLRTGDYVPTPEAPASAVAPQPAAEVPQPAPTPETPAPEAAAPSPEAGQLLTQLDHTPIDANIPAVYELRDASGEVRWFVYGGSDQERLDYLNKVFGPQWLEKHPETGGKVPPVLFAHEVPVMGGKGVRVDEIGGQKSEGFFNTLLGIIRRPIPPPDPSLFLRRIEP